MNSSNAQSAQTISSLQNVPLLQPLSKQQLSELQEAFRKVRRPAPPRTPDRRR